LHIAEISEFGYWGLKRVLPMTAIDISPTPFSPFGVIAMWAIFAVALLAALRRRLGLRPQTWRTAHLLLAIVIVVGSVVHGILIDEGMMRG
jgi:hypothetical protein